MGAGSPSVAPQPLILMIRRWLVSARASWAQQHPARHLQCFVEAAAAAELVCAAPPQPRQLLFQVLGHDPPSDRDTLGCLDARLS